MLGVLTQVDGMSTCVMSLSMCDVFCEKILRCWQPNPVYIDTGCGGVAVGGKFWPKNADFAPREALNNVNNNSDCQH